jgi:hypothetical protein
MQYNELSQLKEKYMHGNSGSYMQKQSFAYNIRGWLTDINSLGSGSPAKSEEFHSFYHHSFYTQPKIRHRTGTGARARANGGAAPG